jgi:hypothetical protein
MLSLALSLMLSSLAPEPPVGPGDDFNDVVAGLEKQSHCDASRLYRTDPDSMRMVVFSCQDGEVLVPLAYVGKDGWVPIERIWIWTPPKMDGSAI